MDGMDKGLRDGEEGDEGDGNHICPRQFSSIPLILFFFFFFLLLLRFPELSTAFIA